MYSRDYDSYLSLVADSFVENINQEWQEPWDLAVLNETIGFIRSMIAETHVTPYVQDGFIYAGFSYFMDSPDLALMSGPQKLMTVKEVKAATKRLVEHHPQQFQKIIDQIFYA